MRTKWFVFGLGLILAACQSLSATPFPKEYSEKVDLGNYELQLTCAGKGEPTLIFENAHNYLGSGYSWNAGTPARFEGISRSCIYRKYEKSLTGEEQVTGARTAMDQVKDLHNLLKKAGVPGPYILVGHSTAAWNMLLYTQKYPNEVVGLICVDCAPPGIWSTFFERMETEQVQVSESDQESLDLFQNYLDDYTKNVESLDLAASSKLAEEVTDLGNRPFVVLGVEPTDENSADPATVLIESLWLSLDQNMCNLSSRCRFEIVSGVSEMSMITNKAVDEAVKEVYDAVKEK